MTYAGQALTRLCLIQNSSGNLTSAIYSLASAPASSSGGVLVQLDLASPLLAETTSWSSAKAPAVCSSRSGNSASSQVTGPAGSACRVVDLVAARTTAQLTPDPGQASLVAFGQSGLHVGASHKPLSAGTTSWTMGWSWSTGAAADWVIVAAALEAGP